MGFKPTFSIPCSTQPSIAYGSAENGFNPNSVCTTNDGRVHEWYLGCAWLVKPAVRITVTTCTYIDQWLKRDVSGFHDIPGVH